MPDSTPEKRPAPKWQEHDLWYVVDRVHDLHWKQPRHLIEKVVASCQELVKPLEGRDELLAVALQKMRDCRSR